MSFYFNVLFSYVWVNLSEVAVFFFKISLTNFLSVSWPIHQHVCNESQTKYSKIFCFGKFIEPFKGNFLVFCEVIFLNVVYDKLSCTLFEVNFLGSCLG